MAAAAAVAAGQRGGDYAEGWSRPCWLERLQTARTDLLAFAARGRVLEKMRRVAALMRCAFVDAAVVGEKWMTSVG